MSGNGSPRPPDDHSVQEILHAIRRILHEDGMSDTESEPFPLDESMLVGQSRAETPAPETSLGAHLTSAEPAAAASSAFADLRAAVAPRAAGLGRAGATIEDIVREEVRPLLAAWLDRHLPGMVERLVRAEVQRLSGT